MANKIRSGVEQPPNQMTTVADVPIVERVGIEQQHTGEYTIMRSTKRETAERREQTLVLSYGDFLERKGHSVVRHRYQLPQGSVLVCDLFDETQGVLYEAKGEVSREALRMAVGQLFDYRRFEDHDPILAVLLPRRPSEDLIDFVSSVQLAVVWKTTDGFEEVWQQL